MRTVPDIQTDIDQTEYQRDYLNARLSRLHSEMQDAMARENLFLTEVPTEKGTALTPDALAKWAVELRSDPHVESAEMEGTSLRVRYKLP